MTLNHLRMRLQSWSFGGMWSTPSVPLLTGPEVVVPDRVQSMGQEELLNHLTVYKQMTDIKLNCYCYITILKTT